MESFYILKHKLLKVVDLGQYCLNLFEHYIWALFYAYKKFYKHFVEHIYEKELPFLVAS